MGKHSHHDRDETDEEKRARRLAKKERKREKEAALQIPGYSNDANRWNDPNLSQAFTWKRKDERDQREGKASAEHASADSLKRRREEQLQELDKVKRAREEREAEKAAWEEEKAMLEREREQMAFHDNEKREEEFMLAQARKRAHIRVGEGRARPIDLVSESLALLQPDLDLEAALDIRAEDPRRIFENCQPRELRELHAEICKRGQLDVPNADFWQAMRKLCEVRLAPEAGGGAGGSGTGGAGGAGLNDAVRAEVALMLQGKTAAELDELQQQIDLQLAEGDADATDGDYWSTVAEQLGLARAEGVVADAFARMKTVKAQVMAQQRGRSSDDEAEGGDHAAGDPWGGDPDGSELQSFDRRGGGGEGDGGGRYSPELFDDAEAADNDGGVGEAPSMVGAVSTDDAHPGAAGMVSSGRFSPPLLSAHQVTGEAVVDAETDLRQTWEERQRIRASLSGGGGGAMVDVAARAREPSAAPARAGSSSSSGAGPSGTQPSRAGPSGTGGQEHPEDAAAAALVEAEARRGMEAGEARFSFEVPLEKKVTWWHDKYRPRKPKYFNRVHTGYEWNKYNQTHYDHDNPPPKMVQGYKFAIFYPDLIDRTQTPTYSLQPDPGGAKDTCILKFKGGPPYEDLAFKIVNHEWEQSHKRGFRCRFERGILQVNFNFKRHRYRR